jgi:tetratricopeptide (TPR) repeat protein
MPLPRYSATPRAPEQGRAPNQREAMYTILIAIGVGIVSGLVWTLLGLWKTWAMGMVLGTLMVGLTFVLVSRRIAKGIEPKFQQIQKQIQGGNTALAVKGLEQMLPLAKWQVMLKGQLYAQLGSLCFTIGQEQKAFDYLTKASPRVADGQLFLASLHSRRKEPEKARKVLDSAIRYNKKQLILYNVYAWILVRDGDRDGAIEQLLRALKVEKGNENTKDNLLRLQNGKKMNMKKFGMAWYGLQFEKLPASMRQGQAQGRKGFRQKRSRR